MIIKVLIPTPFRTFTEKKSEVQIQGDTIEEVLNNLVLQYPSLKRHLFMDNGRLRNIVKIYINDKDSRFLKGEKTRLNEGDTISIVPVVAGGNHFKNIYIYYVITTYLSVIFII